MRLTCTFASLTRLVRWRNVLGPSGASSRLQVVPRDIQTHVEHTVANQCSARGRNLEYYRVDDPIDTIEVHRRGPEDLKRRCVETAGDESLVDAGSARKIFDAIKIARNKVVAEQRGHDVQEGNRHAHAKQPPQLKAVNAHVLARDIATPPGQFTPLPLARQNIRVACLCGNAPCRRNLVPLLLDVHQEAITVRIRNQPRKILIITALTEPWDAIQSLKRHDWQTEKSSRKTADAQIGCA